MDIGVYCIHPLIKLFGMPKHIQSNAVILENGMDGAGTITVNYGHMQGELMYSKITNSKLPSQLQGEKGCMIIKEISDINELTIIYNDGTIEEIKIDKQKNDMFYELEEFISLIRGERNSEKNLCFSLMQLTIMDEVRKQNGITFPADS